MPTSSRTPERPNEVDGERIAGRPIAYDGRRDGRAAGQCPVRPVAAAAQCPALDQRKRRRRKVLLLFGHSLFRTDGRTFAAAAAQFSSPTERTLAGRYSIFRRALARSLSQFGRSLRS